MRVAFLGTPTFAVPSLELLLDSAGHEVCAVFTQPDRPSGRGQRLHPSPVKVCAMERGVPVFQPERIRNEENRPGFERLKADFVVVVAYGQILPKWLLKAARLAAVNVHASLLPRYRGAAPIAWAILNGDAVTGISTMVMEEKVDAGPVLLQQEISIPFTMTAGELTETLSVVGAKLLVQTLDRLWENELEPIPQDESGVSWAPRITKGMAHISWEQSAVRIHNQVRAMNPWPVAYTFFRNDRLQIWRSLNESQVSEARVLPGTYLGLSRSGIRVQCGEETILEILELQLAGKSRVTGKEFASGVHLRVGELIFSPPSFFGADGGGMLLRNS